MRHLSVGGNPHGSQCTAVRAHRWRKRAHPMRLPRQHSGGGRERSYPCRRTPQHTTPRQRCVTPGSQCTTAAVEGGRDHTHVAGHRNAPPRGRDMSHPDREHHRTACAWGPMRSRIMVSRTSRGLPSQHKAVRRASRWKERGCIRAVQCRGSARAEGGMLVSVPQHSAGGG